MGLLDFFRRDKTESISLSAGSNIFSNQNLIGYNELLEIPAIYSAIELISNTVSSLEIKLYEENETGVSELKNDHRLYCFNDEPNILMTGVELKKAIIRDYLIFGNAYIYINSESKKLSLNYVPASKVSILENTTNPIEPQIRLSIGGSIYYPHEFIILTKNTLTGVKGRGVLQECQALLNLAYMQSKFTLLTLANGGMKRGVLKIGAKMDNDSLSSLKKNFDDIYAGRKNTLILNNGTEYEELQQSEQETELVDLKSSINKDILTIFDIPENLFNNNIPTELWQMFIKSSINPILTKIEQALNKSLLTREEKETCYFAFDTKQLMKGDISTRFEAYEIAIKNGFMTRNEVRFEEDLQELNGLDNISLSLGEVFMDTKTGNVYTPNTDSYTELGTLKKGGESSDENGN